MKTNKNKILEAPKIGAEWEQKSKLLRRRFPQLQPADLKFDRGNENDLLERIESKLKKTRAEVIEIINKTITNQFINNLKINYHE